MINSIKDELQNILQGKSKVSHGELIQTITSYLRGSESTSTLAKTDKHFKCEEKKRLIDFISENKLWINEINLELYLSEGAEQKVYLKDEDEVYKLNDSIYYSSWLDYFYNLLLNNYFFPDTAYNLIGFYKIGDILYAQVEQNYIKTNQKTDLKNVKIFMTNNGFINTRNHDYYNPDLGIILEDLHDENVLTNNDSLYFIDTVFFIKSEIFWTKN